MTILRRDIRLLLIPVLFITLFIPELIAPTHTRAAEFNPTTVEDLIGAINEANNNNEADTINLTTGDTYTLTANITLETGLPQITSDITINGNGATIERDANTTEGFRIFYNSSGNLTLNDLTISNGNPVNSGGGIFNYGTLTINNSTISNCRASKGGGIYNYFRTSEINNSTISNCTSGYGGGIMIVHGTATINNNTISNCRASQGGGIYNFYSTLEINSSTISNNTATGRGGGIVNEANSLTLINTIIANNTGYDPSGITRFNNCYNHRTSSILDGSNNLIEGGIFNEGTLNLTNTITIDPMLGPLADNYGPTKTHALLAGSLAIDAGTDSTIVTDQRGISRPQDGDCDGTADYDIGAFEFAYDDGDGVSPNEENGAPNGGDGNGDGTPDCGQANVASLSTATGDGYITLEILEADECDGWHDVEIFSDPGDDPDYFYPFGLVKFRLNCESARIRIYFHGSSDISSFIYRKFGPMPPDFSAPEWYTLPDVTWGTVEIDGETAAYAEFILTDGAIGDDTDDDGWIVDQGGPGESRATIPTVNEWGVIILSLLLAGATILISRRNTGLML